MRQSDVATAAALSQQTVSRIEAGRFDAVGLGTLRRVAGALGITLALECRWRGPELARLIDERHSEVVDRIVEKLVALGWKAVVEYTFNLRGERGAVDVLGWHEATRALLIVEVKTRLVDLQEMLGTLDRKTRSVRLAVEGQFGWRPAALGVVLVLPDEPAQRGMVARRRATFEVAFPARAIEVREWLARPSGPLRGLWFLSDTRAGSAIKKPGGPNRMRVRAPTPAHRHHA